MKRVGSPGGGYTIVEVMIVLAVSSALLISALLVFRGQGNRTDFIQTVRDFESRMQDVINDVSTGYYQSGNDFSCKYNPNPGTGIKITPVAAKIGTNDNCIFIGKIILFGPDVSLDNTDPSHDNSLSLSLNGFRVFTVAGQRLGGNNKPVEDISAHLQNGAKPLIVAPGNVHSNDAPYEVDDAILNPSINIESVKYVQNGTTAAVPAIGIFTTFGKQKDGFLLSGSTSSDLLAFPPSLITNGNPKESRNFVDNIDERFADATLDPAIAYPSITNGEVQICLSSNGISPTQYGLIKISGSNRQLSTTSIITSESCI